MRRVVLALGLVGAALALTSGGPASGTTFGCAAGEPCPIPPECHGGYATIEGTSDDDTIYGTRDSDVIVGGSGADRVFGRGGRDLICGRSGSDLILGGPEEDGTGPTGPFPPPGGLFGGPGRDRIFGGSDDDDLFGGNQADLLDGGRGDDLCRGGRPGEGRRHDADTLRACEEAMPRRPAG